MPTQYIARLLLAIPASGRSNHNTWWAGNIDTGGSGDRTFAVPYSATGSLPATHYVMCGAFTAPQLKKIMQRLCTLAGISAPANWDTMTRHERRDWLRSQTPTILTKGNLKAMVMDDNDGTWSDYPAALAAKGLKVVRA